MVIRELSCAVDKTEIALYRLCKYRFPADGFFLNCSLFGFQDGISAHAERSAFFLSGHIGFGFNVVRHCFQSNHFGKGSKMPLFQFFENRVSDCMDVYKKERLTLL